VRAAAAPFGDQLGMDRMRVRKVQVVGGAVADVQLELAQRDATRSVEVGGADVLHRPAGSGQQAVDLLPCLFFRCAHVARSTLVGNGASLPRAAHFCWAIRLGSAIHAFGR
jgi:hypothetical protein